MSSKNFSSSACLTPGSINQDPALVHHHAQSGEVREKKQVMEDLWTLFCGDSGRLKINEGPLRLDIFSQPNSCVNLALMILLDFLLLIILLFISIKKSRTEIPPRLRGVSSLQISSAIFNGCLGLVYLCLAIWTLEENLRKTRTALPLGRWLLMFLQGFTSLSVGLTVSLRGRHFGRTPLRLLAVLAFLVSGIVCAFSVFAVILGNGVSVKVALDIVSFPAAILLLFCACKSYKQDEIDDNQNGLYAPLNGDQASSVNKSDQATPFAKAGVFSNMSFWWLNPLMKKGKEKTLEDEDMPKLRRADQAKSCYAQFLEQVNKQEQAKSSSQPSLLRTIVSCHSNEIFVSGSFALLKILTLSAGPMLLNNFILAAEGKSGFKYEGYILALALFILKILGSLSQQQWNFRSRLIGLKVRSLLTAAIYRKQLRLSNAGRLMHSGSEIMNYVTVDAYRIGEFPFWFHQTWTTSLQLCISLVILFNAVGLATVAALVVLIITALCNIPLAKLQHKYQSKLMVAQDKRLKACTEALVNMKVLKLYAWEKHFKNVIEDLRKVEYKWLSAVQLRRAYNGLLFWCSPLLVSTATFGACYFLNVPLHANNVFTFIATLQLVQDPIRTIPDVIGVVIQAKVAFARIVKYLDAPELQNGNVRQKQYIKNANHAVSIESANFSWEEKSSKPTLRNVNLEIRPGDKLAVCGEVGSGKSSLLAAILGEVPKTQGTIKVYGRIAYVSQTAWIQSGTVRENILFGSAIDIQRYHDTLERCSLVKDLDLLPHGDLTEIGERGVNLSGGQKQRIQLARALYKDADIYLLDDPFSAVDAQTAMSLFNEYIMGALARKTVLLVTHQVDFLPAFDSVLLMSDGDILRSASYHQLLASSQEFQDLVNAHKETAGSKRLTGIITTKRTGSSIKKSYIQKQLQASKGNQSIKQEEREIGDTGLKPYIQYLSQNKGYLLFSIAALSQVILVIGQISQSSWMAANVDKPDVTPLRLIVVYLIIGATSSVFIFMRSLSTVMLGLQSSTSLFSQLLHSLFRSPMSFYDSTPLGRILSRVSSDLSIVDLDVPFGLVFVVATATIAYSNLGILAVVAWQVLFVSIPMIYLAIRLQRYYFASAKELMRINGTTKSLVANHLAESVAGAMTIRSFEEEERFFAEYLDLVDTNASPFFHNFAANEWLIQRLEALSAIVLASATLCMVSLPPGTFSPGLVGMALSYGLSLNVFLVSSIQTQCTIANYIISVERLNQYMHIPSEAPEVIEDNRSPPYWPTVGKVEICDLQIRYRSDAPLVLRGISCTFQGGHKIGIVGRTGSGKTTLIGAIFRLVEPTGGKIIVDGMDISKIGLHDLRSRFGIIPQDPTLFSGTVRYNLDPLSQHTDQEIWEVLGKCQLREAVQEKDNGLDSMVMEDGANWSMGQRQLFCLGRALLRRSRVLVLDEATASIDNATDLILQKTIRSEFATCTVITVAHRIPTVMDCTMVLTISDGELVEYDEPTRLMNNKGSMFGQLVKEYWSHYHSAESH
ncbi:ABC transporter C family member 10-like [Mercurialis annua]|uniref:ABC transporter C family member 10-like n=1 Tax=Mercurialis annua TaxID=3986 RepID=UPI0021607ED6|nr:ABC transporter C family member 10-like [Mercurialis annua]